MALSLMWDEIKAKDKTVEVYTERLLRIKHELSLLSSTLKENHPLKLQYGEIAILFSTLFLPDYAVCAVYEKSDNEDLNKIASTVRDDVYEAVLKRTLLPNLNGNYDVKDINAQNIQNSLESLYEENVNKRLRQIQKLIESLRDAGLSNLVKKNRELYAKFKGRFSSVSRDENYWLVWKLEQNILNLIYNSAEPNALELFQKMKADRLSSREDWTYLDLTDRRFHTLRSRLCIPITVVKTPVDGIRHEKEIYIEIFLPIKINELNSLLIPLLSTTLHNFKIPIAANGNGFNPLTYTPLDIESAENKDRNSELIQRAIEKLEDCLARVLGLSNKQVYTLRFFGSYENEKIKDKYATFLDLLKGRERHEKLWEKLVFLLDSNGFLRFFSYGPWKRKKIEDSGVPGSIFDYYCDHLYQDARFGISPSTAHTLLPEISTTIKNDPRVLTYTTSGNTYQKKIAEFEDQILGTPDPECYISLPIILSGVYWGAILIVFSPDQDEENADFYFDRALKALRVHKELALEIEDAILIDALPVVASSIIEEPFKYDEELDKAKNQYKGDFLVPFIYEGQPLLRSYKWEITHDQIEEILVKLEKTSKHLASAYWRLYDFPHKTGKYLAESIKRAAQSVNANDYVVELCDYLYSRSQYLQFLASKSGQVEFDAMRPYDLETMLVNFVENGIYAARFFKGHWDEIVGKWKELFDVQITAQNTVIGEKVEGAVEDLIENLCMNSLEHSDKSPDDLKITIKIAEQENELLLVFADNGHGFKLEKKEKVEIWMSNGPTRNSKTGSPEGFGMWSIGEAMRTLGGKILPIKWTESNYRSQKRYKAKFEFLITKEVLDG